MSAALLTISRGTLVWIVGALTAAEAMLQAFSSLLDGRWDQFALWTMGAILLLVLALLVESYKVPWEG